MDCLSCKASNPDDKKYCGDCGVRLGTESATQGLELRQQVEAVVAERFKDQKVVEVEVAQAIAIPTRRLGKLLGFAVAVPLAPDRPLSLACWV